MTIRRQLAALFGFIGIAVSGAFHVEHRVSCNRKKICNGNLMCAYVCEAGSAVTDPWATSSLRYQRMLQRDDPLVVVEFPATHNSAISEAYGYGIEKYFISALTGGKCPCTRK